MGTTLLAISDTSQEFMPQTGVGAACSPILIMMDYRDLFVGNGYRKDITDQDFIAYSKELAMFSTDKNRLEYDPPGS